jgi:hypothetical protein
MIKIVLDLVQAIENRTEGSIARGLCVQAAGEVKVAH